MLPAIKSNSNLYPLGINIPIKLGNSGFFEQTFDTVSQTKAKIINLLNTKRGERRFQPLFGSRLQQSIFEQNLDSNPEILKKIIIDDVKTWIPEVNIINVNLKLTDDQKNTLKNNYMIYITITFEVDNIVDNVNLTLQQNLT